MNITNKIKEIEHSLEFNIIDYLKDLDNQNKVILNDINILKNKKDQLQELLNIDKQKDKNNFKDKSKNKITQSTFRNKELDINRQLDQIEKKYDEINQIEEELNKTYQGEQKKNKIYIQNLREKEKILLDRIQNKFQLEIQNYKKNRELIQELIKNEQDLIKKLQFEINEIIIEVDNLNKKNVILNQNIQKSLIKINKFLIRNKKMKLNMKKNIV